MQTQILQELNSVKTLSIVGMCKNAGKTTVLNRLLDLLSDRVLGLTSIGRDGESTDVVTGTEKPGIFVREGTLIATAKDMLKLCDVTKEILHTTGIPTPLGEVVILRAKSAGWVQLAGPSIVSQLKTVSDRFFELGASQTIIDGALGRKSLGARSVADGVVLCTGASYDRRMEKVVEDTAAFCRILNLPKAKTLPKPGEGTLKEVFSAHREALIEGALTEAAVVPLLKNGVLKDGRLVVKDPSRVLLGAGTIERLRQKNVALETEDAARTLFVAVNPVSAYGWRFDGPAFVQAMAAAVDVPVIDGKETDE